MEFSSRARWYLKEVSEPGLWLSSSHSCHHETLGGQGCGWWPGRQTQGSGAHQPWSHHGARCSRRDPLPCGVSAPEPRASGRRSRPGRGLHVALGGAAGWGQRLEMASYCLATARPPSCGEPVSAWLGGLTLGSHGLHPGCQLGDISGPAVSPAGSLRLGQSGACRAPGHSNGYVIRARPGIFENP